MQLKLSVAASASSIRRAPETMALWVRMYFPNDVFNTHNKLDRF